MAWGLNNSYFSQIWRLRVWVQGANVVGFWWASSSWITAFCCVFTWQRQREGGSSLCLYEGPTLKLHLTVIISQKNPSPNIITLGSWALTYEFLGWHKSVHSTSILGLCDCLDKMWHDFQDWCIKDSIACDGFSGMLTFGTQPYAVRKPSTHGKSTLNVPPTACTDPVDSQHQPPDNMWRSLREDSSPSHFL